MEKASRRAVSIRFIFSDSWLWMCYDHLAQAPVAMTVMGYPPELWVKIGPFFLKLLWSYYFIIATEKETLRVKGDAGLCLNPIRKDGEQGMG